MTYRCIHVIENLVVTHQLDTDGRETEVQAALCALCGRWFDPNTEASKDKETT